MINQNNLPPMKQQTLWCLPYDTQTFFKQFLKISFSKFLRNLVSNKYFPLYEKQMAKQISNKFEWNDKCWHLLQFFQHLNLSFQISQLDMIVNFIEEELLRKVMGHFRLWIDLQRLYLFNFLKLDRMEFMDDRIYMTLYRTMMFFHTLFSEYDYEDFHTEFIKNFCSKSAQLIEELSEFLSKATKPLAESIRTILISFSKKSATLISTQRLEVFKRQVKVRIVQEAENILDIEERLFHNVKYQEKINEENKMKMILEMSFIDGLTKQIELLVDPKKKIVEDYHTAVFEGLQKEDPKELEYRLKLYEEEKINEKTKYSLYERLQISSHDPYDDANLKVYGSLIHIDIKKKQELQAKQQKQIISKNDDDELKIYYQQDYMKKIQKSQQNSLKVTWRDLAKKNALKNKNAAVQQQGDDQNKIFNLRYTFQQNSARSGRQSGNNSERDFDNNILFKNQIDEYLQTSKMQVMQRFAANNCQTKTFLQLKNKIQKLFPEKQNYSFGSDYYSNHQPLFFSMNKLKTVNRNKFDEMRKIICYMTAQKKIKNLILQKNIPQTYPRNYSDIKNLSYNPLIIQHKINFARKNILEKPQII